MIRNTIKVTVLVLLLTLVASCARHGAALIVSEPEGAEVVDLSDDTVFGITPVKVWWKEYSGRRLFVNVRLQKEGYHDKTTSFWLNLEHGSRPEALRNAQSVEVILDKREE